MFFQEGLYLQQVWYLIQISWHLKFSICALHFNEAQKFLALIWGIPTQTCLCERSEHPPKNRDGSKGMEAKCPLDATFETHSMAAFLDIPRLYMVLSSFHVESVVQSSELSGTYRVQLIPADPSSQLQL